MGVKILQIENVFFVTEQVAGTDKINELTNFKSDVKFTIRIQIIIHKFVVLTFVLYFNL